MRDQKKKIAIEIDQNRLLILFEGLVVPLPPPLFKKVGANEEREEREKFGGRATSWKVMCNFTGERGAIKRGERRGKQINSLSCYEISLDYIRALVPQLPLRCFDPITIIEKSFFRIFWEFNDTFLLNFSSLLFVERLSAILLTSSKTKFWKPILTPRFVKYVPLCRHTRETRKLFLINK